MKSSPYTAFREAVERRDFDSAVAHLAPDVTFYSPVVHKPYQGRDAVRLILLAVGQVFEDFRYTSEYADSTDSRIGHVLRFSCRIGDRSAEGVDILEGDGERITHLTVLLRPYSAATLLRERMAELIAAY